MGDGEGHYHTETKSLLELKRCLDKRAAFARCQGGEREVSMRVGGTRDIEFGSRGLSVRATEVEGRMKIVDCTRGKAIKSVREELERVRESSIEDDGRVG